MHMWQLQGLIKDFAHVFLPCCMIDSLHRFLDFIADLDWKNLVSLAFMLEYFYFQVFEGAGTWEFMTSIATMGFLREFQLWLMQVILYIWLVFVSEQLVHDLKKDYVVWGLWLWLNHFLVCLNLVMFQNIEYWVGSWSALPHVTNPTTWEYSQYIECLVSFCNSQVAKALRKSLLFLSSDSWGSMV